MIYIQYIYNVQRHNYAIQDIPVSSCTLSCACVTMHEILKHVYYYNYYYNDILYVCDYYDKQTILFSKVHLFLKVNNRRYVRGALTVKL